MTNNMALGIFLIALGVIIMAILGGIENLITQKERTALSQKPTRLSSQTNLFPFQFKTGSL